MAEPASWGARRSVLDLLDKLHIARPAVGVYERLLAARAQLRDRNREEADGLPLPPARLRAQVGPLHADASFFLRSGREHAVLIRELLAEDGAAVDELDAILDWGCGCGRVLRHWAGLERTSVLGCDVNPKMVAWCAENLPFASVAVNSMSPPLPYDDSSVGLVYAFSVFTHLPEQLQHTWITECFRVLRPGGHVVISTLGANYTSRDRLTDEELAAFERGELVVLYEGSLGTSLCSAYHPLEYVRGELKGDFRLVASRPAADEGRHDIHLFRKPAAN